MKIVLPAARGIYHVNQDMAEPNVLEHVTLVIKY